MKQRVRSLRWQGNISKMGPQWHCSVCVPKRSRGLSTQPSRHERAQLVEGILPPKQLRVGTDLINAPHALIVLIGQFKGETGFHHHMVSLADMSMSGIELRWWLEKLIEVRESEGCISGLAFRQADRSVAAMYEYNGILHP
jgi:hypothetical protein